MGRNDEDDVGCADSMEYICVCGPLWDCVFDDDDYDYIGGGACGGGGGRRGYLYDDSDNNSIAMFSPFGDDYDENRRSLASRIREWNERRIANRRRRIEERLKRQEEERAAAEAKAALAEAEADAESESDAETVTTEVDRSTVFCR
jgi:hypothetical protein